MTGSPDGASTGTDTTSRDGLPRTGVRGYLLPISLFLLAMGTGILALTPDRRRLKA